MKPITNDTKERLKVGFLFALEAYKIMCGCFLSVFVSHSCDDDDSNADCSVVESFSTFSPTMAVNAATFCCICCLYAVELSRENWCIAHLDIDPKKPDVHLETIAPPPIRQKLLQWNDWYWKGALLSMGMAAINISVSTVYLAHHFRGISTITSAVSFSILVLMKLFGSFTMAKHDKKSVRARSAYLTEHTSFNVLDPDKLVQFTKI